MASFNKVILAGNATRDPQLRNVGNSTITEFGLAVNRKYKTSGGEEREDVLFVDCSAWGKQAEVLNQYVQKGKPLLVEGRLKLDSWEDKQGGGKRSKISVVVENFQFLGSKSDDQSDQAEQEAPRQPARGAPARGRQAAPKQPADELDIPF